VPTGQYRRLSRARAQHHDRYRAGAESLSALALTSARLIALGRVELLDLSAVLLGHDLALDLHRRRQLLAHLKAGIEDLPPFDLLRVREFAVPLMDRVLDPALDRRVVRPDPGRGHGGIEGDQRRHEGTAVAEHDNLGDAAPAVESVLDRSRGDVFAAGGFEEVLLAIRDPQEPIVQDADVAGAQPPVYQRLRGRCF